MVKKELKVCSNCGFKGNEKLYTKGNIGTELVLWLFFIIPGIFYSVWRHASRYYGCPECSASNMLPLDSPLAQKLLNTTQPPTP